MPGSPFDDRLELVSLPCQLFIVAALTAMTAPLFFWIAGFSAYAPACAANGDVLQCLDNTPFFIYLSVTSLLSTAIIIRIARCFSSQP